MTYTVTCPFLDLPLGTDLRPVGVAAPAGRLVFLCLAPSLLPLRADVGVPQVDLAREHGHAARAAHSVRAVEMRASRIRCSLAVQTVCPECGAVGVMLNCQTGMCRLCSERYHLEQERAFSEQLEREREAVENGATIEEVRRERDRLRQRNSRLCRKFGLPGKRG